MLIDRVVGARLQGRAEPCDLVLADGVVTAIEPASIAQPAADTTRTGGRSRASGPDFSHEFGGVRGGAGVGVLDAAGRVVVPAFVDAHVHLDKAFLLPEAEALGPVEPRLESAIVAVERVRKAVSLADIRTNAVRTVATLARHGVVAARAHVEVTPSTGLDLLSLHVDVDRDGAGVALQLVAFPQLGLELPGAIDLLRAAMGAGATVVGGCPYVDDDPVAHLDAVFGLADQLGAPVDLHLDFTDDAARSHLDLVVERTQALGMAGQVAIGHVTTLAALPREGQAAAFERLAVAGVALVVLPATDLYLGGHGDPGTRSLAPLERAAAAGVTVAIANNNLANPFAPFGNGSLVQAAWLTGITRRLGGPDGRRLLLDAISTQPAAILGRAPHGPAVGARADLVLLDTTEPDHAVTQAPQVLATVRGGELA